MSESFSAIFNALEFLGDGVIFGLLGGPEWHAWIGALSSGRTLLTAFCGGGWLRDARRTRKQAGRQSTADTGASP